MITMAVHTYAHTACPAKGHGFRAHDASYIVHWVAATSIVVLSSFDALHWVHNTQIYSAENPQYYIIMYLVFPFPQIPTLHTRLSLTTSCVTSAPWPTLTMLISNVQLLYASPNWARNVRLFHNNKTGLIVAPCLYSYFCSILSKDVCPQIVL